MPSSGWPAVNIIDEPLSGDAKEFDQQAGAVRRAAKQAMQYGLFIEWLECFVGARNAGASTYEAAEAGLIEWDL